MFDKNYFEKIFQKGTTWGCASSRYEYVKYVRQTEIMKHFAPEARHILEIGCAEGTHARMIARAYPDASILSLDIAPSAVEKARKNCRHCGNIEVMEGDIIALLEQRYFQPDSFDIVVQSESMYMLFPGLASTLTIGRYLRSMREIMKKEGIFITANGMKGLTRFIMPVYYSVLKRLYETAYESRFREWNDYRNDFWTYELRVFRRTG
jgi:SAM-dependent methyltransferase